MARFRVARRLYRVDLPTFGRPTITTRKAPPGAGALMLGLGIAASAPALSPGVSLGRLGLLRLRLVALIRVLRYLTYGVLRGPVACVYGSDRAGRAAERGPETGRAAFNGDVLAYFQQSCWRKGNKQTERMNEIRKLILPVSLGACWEAIHICIQVYSFSIKHRENREFERACHPLRGRPEMMVQEFSTILAPVLAIHRSYYYSQQVSDEQAHPQRPIVEMRSANFAGKCRRSPYLRSTYCLLHF